VTKGLDAGSLIGATLTIDRALVEFDVYVTENERTEFGTDYFPIFEISCFNST